MFLHYDIIQNGWTERRNRSDYSKPISIVNQAKDHFLQVHRTKYSKEILNTTLLLICHFSIKQLYFSPMLWKRMMLCTQWYQNREAKIIRIQIRSVWSKRLPVQIGGCGKGQISNIYASQVLTCEGISACALLSNNISN